MKTQTNKLVALGTGAALLVGTMGGVGISSAQASTKGRRNTTLALGAVTAYGLLKHNKTMAIAGGVGTALAYSRYRKSKKQDQRRSAWLRRHRYGRSYRYSHRY